jgi:hypothetical protein
MNVTDLGSFDDDQPVKRRDRPKKAVETHDPVEAATTACRFSIEVACQSLEQAKELVDHDRHVRDLRRAHAHLLLLLSATEDAIEQIVSLLNEWEAARG